MSDSAPTRDLQNRFESYVARHELLPDSGVVVVGVSGGADSVCLLHLLNRSALSLHVVHVNYGFRGLDSDGDEQLVREVCQRWSIPLTVHRADDSWRRKAGKRSLHEEARTLRYRLMHEVAIEVGSQTVAVGHHLDDQAETVLLRLIRGTGLPGLAAIRARRPLQEGSEVVLVRPLLFASRHEIDVYAGACGLTYRDDVSNKDERFDRAKVRYTILPAITAAFGDAGVRNIADAAHRVQELLDDPIGPIIDGDLEATVDVRADGVHLGLNNLAALAPGRRRLVLLLALQRYLPAVPQRSSVIERTEALLGNLPGKRLRFESGTIWRDRESIVLVVEPVVQLGDPSPIQPGVRNETSYGSITLEEIAPALGDLTHDVNCEIVDGRVLNRPLSLGAWLPGERFQPLGLSGTKKISDFLTDVKVPTYTRSSVPVLRSGQEVVWIPGHRIAHPFRLTSASTSAVRITFKAPQ